MRILIVDPNLERARLIEQALHEAGDDSMQIAAEPGHLLDLLRQTDPDAVIVALDEPDTTVIAQLATASAEHPRPVVMFVRQSDSAALQAAVSAGVSSYVVDGLQAARVKPILDVAVARFREAERLRHELDTARASLAERKLIDRAKGILMQARGLTEDDAYILLRSKAMAEQKKLSEIAQSVITAAALLK